MLVHVEIPGMSLNLQDPLLRLTGIHPRQTGGPLLARFLLTAQEGERRAYSSPGPAGVFGRLKLLFYNLILTVELLLNGGYGMANIA